MGDGFGAAVSLGGGEPGVELGDGAVGVEVSAVEAAVRLVLGELVGTGVLRAACWGD